MFARLHLGMLGVVCCLILAANSGFWWGPAPQGLSRAVAQVPVTTGQQVQAMLESLGGLDEVSANLGSGLPICAGVAMRVQGRVRRKEGAAPLAAPLSGRACVLYAASASRGRNDGVHAPPLAFLAAGSDFEVELCDGSGVRLAVRGHDVELFGAKSSARVERQTFSNAPQAWRGFVVSNLVPAADASTHFGACRNLGSDGAVLEFRECVLLDGCMVTCVGEVAYDCEGKLGLYPWRPPLEKVAGGETAFATSVHWLQKAALWLASAFSTSMRSDPLDGLVGRVMASEDPALLSQGSRFPLLTWKSGRVQMHKT